MTAKLRSILRQTPWSLALKAGLAGLAWLFLPGWIFLAYVLWLYFVPPFRAQVLILFFCLYLAAALRLPPTPVSALALAGLLYLILGTKDLLLIDRASALAVLTFGFILLLALQFFYSLGHSSLANAWAGVILLGLITFGLLLVFLRSLGARSAGPFAVNVGVGLAAGLLALFLAQLAWALLFLPLNFLDQTALWFLAAVAGTQLAADYCGARLNRRKIFLNFAVFLVFGAVILASNQWSL